MSGTLAFPELLRITGADTSPEHRLVAMRGFAERFQWTPSYEIQGSFGIGPVTGHLVVEHGLDNAATISFLRAPFRARDLDQAQLRALLAISYNNLIDWHLFVSDSDVRSVYNLARPAEAGSAGAEADRTNVLVAGDAHDYLSAAALRRRRADMATGRTLRACDDALIQVVGRWKALLTADYPGTANQNISALFNAMIFIRGCEDRHLDRQPGAERLLLSTLERVQGASIDLGALLLKAFAATGVGGSLPDFIAMEALEPFQQADRATAANLFRDMYAPREAPYEFNFTLMSKHALSRIYEKYVALLKTDPDAEEGGRRQMSLMAPIPAEVVTRRSGAVYTPQFVAGFFARYIRENVTPRRLRDLRSIDPACGSGIFLRTLLELQCDPAVAGVTPAVAGQALRNAEGVDRDPNACEATRLSLALLHLVATGELPARGDLKVLNRDSISAASAGEFQLEAYGAVIINPPYVKLDHLTAGERETYRDYLSSGNGRLDAYLPFVKLCLELVEPGGFICLVLPQAFMTATNAAGLRRRVADDCDVRCLVDLTAVPVFEGVGAYTILLVLQRRLPGQSAGAAAQIARVTDSAGAALQACLDGQEEETPSYSVYRVSQKLFRSREWVLVSPARLRFDDRLKEMPRLSDFMEVKQGFVSGADDVFIVPKSDIPPGEAGIFADYLPDRQIHRYRLPSETLRAVLLPMKGDELLTEEQMKGDYPKVWKYLLTHRPKLEERGSVRAGKLLWWRPERPRSPDTLLRPKIVCPHIMLTPRFAIDATGTFAVSRAPFVLARDDGEEETLLRFFCAVLNSSVCNWHLRAYSSKYSRGYNRLEVPTIRAVPVPDLRAIDPGALLRVTAAVGRLSADRGREQLDEDTDVLVAEIYGFTARERRELLGMA